MDDNLLAQIEQELKRLGEVNDGSSPDTLRDVYALVTELQRVCVVRGHEHEPHRQVLEKLGELARRGRELWPVYSPELLQLFGSAFQSCREDCDRIGDSEKYQI